ncbi:MAG: glutaminyl-peptide cyclotransferase, partial [Bacteroidales bacterium]|nr:glutaminyl-peptide cyclotransferase [Bacteroidales bacterium]
SCDRKTHFSGGAVAEKVIVKKLTSLELSAKDTKYVIGQDINLKLNKPDALEIDSVQLFFRGKKQGVSASATSFSIPTLGNNPGSAVVRVKVFYDDSIHESDSRRIELLSDIVPKMYNYTVVNTFKHDIGAYTQGLQYYDGFLFEGTGNYNQSSLRKVSLQNGDILQSRNNASDIFGEGITIFQGKIYQLTYKKQVCFVYDLNTFEEVQRHHFQNKEGWGLTNNGEELIMSDGSHIIYFIDPAMFTVKRQIEVYNNEGPVTSLNELEYIDGKIYANRYYTDEIVIIDPNTGKEEGRVNMKGLLAVKDRKPSTNVLNGIAWDDEGKRLFVTGKYWPKLFEIELK